MTGQPSSRTTLEAPAHWRCIDFISDLHLDAQHPKTFAVLSAYLAQTPADAIFVLGDLFEAWVGDDMRHQPFEAACTQAFTHASKRLWLGIMVGNRDFLLGVDMLQACGAHHVSDPTVLRAFGENHVLTHGDAWCLTDTSYLALRQQVRSTAWQRDFLAKPLSERLQIARQMRDASQAHQQQTAASQWADVDPVHATQWLAASDSLSLIHGHTHKPASEPFARAGAVRHVLSDWDMDGMKRRAQVLRLSSNGMHRINLPDTTVH